MTARQLAALRRKLKVSQEKFAQLVGVSWRTINRWEKGEYPIPEEQAAKIREASSDAAELQSYRVSGS